MTLRTRRPIADRRGQSLVEFTIILPLVLVLAFGVAEIGFLLVDQHVVTKLTREGSNMISRNTTLQDAVAALTTMSAPPVQFPSRSKVILSVLKRGATTGTANYDRIFLYQRVELGTLPDQSQLRMRGGGTFSGPPNYQAANPDTSAGLQVTNVPSDLTVVRGGMIYVTEIFTRHDLLTPLERFNVPVPRTLYSIAYF